MKRFHIQGQSGTSIIQVGPALAEIEQWLPLSRTVIVTDGPVYRLHGGRLPSCPVIEIGTGEAAKTLETVAAVHRRLLALEADRGTFLLVVGGGLVCDVGGFVASTYMRGIRFALVATTLLAQVDASVGGKNGVNLDGYKNIVGVFNQPERVVCDPSLLATLPPKALGCGFAHDATCLLLAFAFETLGLQRIYLRTNGFNLKNIALNEDLGFHFEGILRASEILDGQLVDVVQMSMLADEFRHKYTIRELAAR